VRLLVQPGAGVAPLLSAIRSAKKSVEIMIFRFDEREIELALEKAITRGVFVHALIAYTNRGRGRESNCSSMTENSPTRRSFGSCSLAPMPASRSG
jgi:phosphatidylserine/phosphatidylglycerophosphate/cardiolipin synthase-like enzyme